MAKNKKKSSIVKLIVILLGLLAFLSVVILFTRLAISKQYVDEIFVVDSEVDFVETSDDEVIWGDNADITIFRVTEVNEDGSIVVESSDGTDIIAPGMEGNYNFQIKNKCKFAVNTETLVEIEFLVNGELFENAPIEVRLINYQNEYISSNDWTNVNEVEQFYDLTTVGKNCYIYYDLDWRWNFEGNDELDTLLGNLSVDNNVELRINIATAASRARESDAEGGIPIPDGILGDTPFDLTPFIILNCVALVTFSVLLYYENRKFEKKNNYND